MSVPPSERRILQFMAWSRCAAVLAVAAWLLWIIGGFLHGVFTAPASGGHERWLSSSAAGAIATALLAPVMAIILAYAGCTVWSTILLLNGRRSRIAVVLLGLELVLCVCLACGAFLQPERSLLVLGGLALGVLDGLLLRAQLGINRDAPR